MGAGLELLDSHISRPDSISQEQQLNCNSGTISLRNALFVLFFLIGMMTLYFYESDDIPRLANEAEVLRKIEQIKPGMIQMQVRAIVGDPLRSEEAPFPENSMPIKNPELKNNREAERLFLSIQRDIFQLKFADSDDNARAYDLEIYYDNDSTVCFIHHSLDNWLVWDLVEMW